MLSAEEALVEVMASEMTALYPYDGAPRMGEKKYGEDQPKELLSCDRKQLAPPRVMATVTVQ